MVGTVGFSARCFAALLDHPQRGDGFDLVGLVTHPAGKQGINSDYVDLGPTAQAHGVDVLRTRKTQSDKAFAAIAAWKPDLIWVLGWSRLLDERLLTLPRLGCIGSHPAPIPEGRGRHPLIWTIIQGRQQGALSLFSLEAGPDTGPVWLQRTFPIGDDDHAETVYDRLCALGAEMVGELMTDLLAGTARSTPQDHSRATSFRRRRQDDGVIRWHEPAAHVHRLVRALARPYVGATARREAGPDITCWRVSPLERGRTTGKRPGTVLSASADAIEVACADHSVIIEKFDCSAWPQVGEVLPSPERSAPGPYTIEGEAH